MRNLREEPTKIEIVSRLGRLGPHTPRRWGKMNAGQMVCHLRDSYRGVMGDLPMEIPAGFSFWRLTKAIALWAPMQWPQGVPTRPELDQVALGKALGEFESDRAGLIAAVERFSAQPPRFEFCPHPLFGRMTEREWMRWGYLHADHHLRQFGL